MKIRQRMIICILNYAGLKKIMIVLLQKQKV